MLLFPRRGTSVLWNATHGRGTDDESTRRVDPIASQSKEPGMEDRRVRTGTFVEETLAQGRRYRRLHPPPPATHPRDATRFSSNALHLHHSSAAMPVPPASRERDAAPDIGPILASQLAIELCVPAAPELTTAHPSAHRATVPQGSTSCRPSRASAAGRACSSCTAVSCGAA